MSQQATATASYSAGYTEDVSSRATWFSDDTSILAVDSSGRVTYGNGGRVYGGRAGISASIVNVTGSALVRLVAADSGSQLMPFSDQQWADCGLSPWGAYGAVQEATGNLVLSGAAGYTLTAVAGAGAPLHYGTSVADWTRKALGIDSVVATRIRAAAATGPNPATTSVAWLAYVRITGSTGASGESIMGLNSGGGSTRIRFQRGLTDQPEVELNVYGRLRRVVGPSAQKYDDRVHPLLLVYNRTSAEVWACTDLGLMMSSSLAAAADSDKGIGGDAGGSNGAAAQFLYFATATGSIVEAIANASGAADFLTRLGWSVSWKNCPTDSSSIKLPFLPHHWAQISESPWAVHYNCQEATGNLVSIDPWIGRNDNGFSLSPTGEVRHQQADLNWSRRSVKTSEIANQRFAHFNVTMASGTSHAMLAYCKLGTVATSNRAIFGREGAVSSTSAMLATYNTTGVPNLVCGANVTVGTNDHRTGRYHPFLVVYDATNSRAKLYTDLDCVTGSYASLTSDGGFAIGSPIAGRLAGAVNCNYFAFCTGSTAESLSDDGRAAQFLQRLNWNPSWAPFVQKNYIAVEGQSNALGVAHISGVTVWADLVNGYAAVKLVQHLSLRSDPMSFVDAGPDNLGPRTSFMVGQPTGTFGVEVAAGRVADRASVYYSGTLVFGKVAIDSSGLHLNWRVSSSYPTSPSGGPNLHHLAKAYHQTQLDSQHAVFSGKFWIQGEEDSKSLVTASLYKDNLLEKLANERATFGNFPFFFNRLHINSGGGGAGVNEIRYQQTQFAATASDVYMIDCDDLVLKDSAHFTPDSSVHLGYRFGQAFATATLGV